MKITSLICGMTLATVALASPAIADAPTEFSDSTTFPDVNPCTGDIHTVSIDFTFREHVHAENLVLHIGSVASTSSGHEGSGTETKVISRNDRLRATQNFMLTQPDTGEKFSVKGHLLVDLDAEELLTDTFRLTCVNAGR